MFRKKTSAWFITIIIIVFSVVIVFYLIAVFNMKESSANKSSINKVLPLIINKETPVIHVEDAFNQSRENIFLDTRSQKEYNVSHIAGARYVGFDDFDISRMKDLPKNAPIIMYCSVGKRSDVITQKALANGFTNVRNMYGGIFKWVNDGYPIVDLIGNATDSVHAYNYVWGLLLNKGKKVYD